MAQRKGMMKGKGRGYKNVVGKDPVVHSQSAKGIKQPQKVHFIPEPFGLPRELQPKDMFIEKKPLKDYYRDLRKDFDDLTTSDLQGVVYAKANNIIKDFNIPKDKQMEIEDLLINYAEGELDLNATQRYILDMIPEKTSTKDILKSNVDLEEYFLGKDPRKTDYYKNFKGK